MKNIQLDVIGKELTRESNLNKKKQVEPTPESNSILNHILFCGLRFAIKKFNIIYPDIFCAEQITVWKMMGPNKFLIPKNFNPKKNVLTKKIWVEK